MCNKHRRPFQVMRHGEPIATYPTRGGVATGIQFRRPVAGLVPEVEEREAAIFNGYTWREWRDLPYEERVDSVAHYRIHLLIETHKEDAVSSAIKRK